MIKHKAHGSPSGCVCVTLRSSGQGARGQGEKIMTEPAATVVFTKANDMANKRRRMDFATVRKMDAWLDKNEETVEVVETRVYTN